MFLQFLFKEMDIEIIKKENFIPEFLNFNFKVNLLSVSGIYIVSNTCSGNNEEHAASESAANHDKPKTTQNDRNRRTCDPKEFRKKNKRARRETSSNKAKNTDKNKK